MVPVTVMQWWHHQQKCNGNSGTTNRGWGRCYNLLLLVKTMDNRFPKIKGLLVGRWGAYRIFVNILILLIGPSESQHWKNNTLCIVAKHSCLLHSHISNKGKHSQIC